MNSNGRVFQPWPTSDPNARSRGMKRERSVRSRSRSRGISPGRLLYKAARGELDHSLPTKLADLEKSKRSCANKVDPCIQCMETCEDGRPILKKSKQQSRQTTPIDLTADDTEDFDRSLINSTVLTEASRLTNESDLDRPTSEMSFIKDLERSQATGKTE